MCQGGYSLDSVKAVPGRKTDLKDAEWIAELLQHGLLRPSFIPDRPQRELRDLTRTRTTLIDERSAAVNRLQEVLEDANLKVASVATDVMGVSGRAILAAILAGETDPAALADLAKGQLRKKRAALERALSGRVGAPRHDPGRGPPDGGSVAGRDRRGDDGVKRVPSYIWRPGAGAS